MTLTRHELRRSRTSFWIWTGVISFMLATCVFLYPEMKGQMTEMNDLFASMGSFTAAFGMDKLNFGTLIGYYAIECGNVLGLGGAIYAALTAVGMLSKEERDRTAEFLLTHPVSRTRVTAEKLAALMLQILLLNAVVYAVSVASVAFIGEQIPWKELNLLHLAYLLLQIEIAGICFGVSAFTVRGGAGIGIGIAACFYMMNLIANITESASFLKTITPYGYCDGAELVTNGRLDGGRIAVGMALCAAGIAAAFWQYRRKDVRS